MLLGLYRAFPKSFLIASYGSWAPVNKQVDPSGLTFFLNARSIYTVQSFAVHCRRADRLPALSS